MDLTDCVDIEQSGRAGRITAKIGDKVLPFEWEFGAAPVVAIIYVPSQINGAPETLGVALTAARFWRRSVARSVALSAVNVSTASTTTFWTCANTQAMTDLHWSGSLCKTNSRTII